MKNWLLLSFALVAALLQTGCGGVTESPYLTPSAIRTSFDNVQVRTSHGKLLVTLQDSSDNLEHLRVMKATASNFNGVASLTLTGTVFHPETPHQIQLVFAPAPQPPFNLNLVTKVNGRALTLRADYYGPKALTY